jgi:hypothetical protein
MSAMSCSCPVRSKPWKISKHRTLRRAWTNAFGSSFDETLSVNRSFTFWSMPSNTSWKCFVNLAMTSLRTASVASGIAPFARCATSSPIVFLTNSFSAASKSPSM